MTTRSLAIDDTLYRYLLDVSLHEHPVPAELREAMRPHPRVSMQTAPSRGSSWPCWPS